MAMTTVITVVYECDDCDNEHRYGKIVTPGFVVPNWALPEGWTEPEREQKRVHQCKACTNKRLGE